MRKEAKARIKINELLQNAGWRFFDDRTEKANIVLENNAQNGKITKFLSSFEAKLGVNGDNKFQKLVKKIDELIDTNSLDQEVKNCVNSLKTFIESGNSDNI